MIEISRMRMWNLQFFLIFLFIYKIHGRYSYLTNKKVSQNHYINDVNSHIDWIIYKINYKAITVHVYQSGIFFFNHETKYWTKMHWL